MRRTYTRIGRPKKIVKPVKRPGFESDLRLAEKIYDAEQKLHDINEYMGGVKARRKIPFQELPEVFENKVRFLKSLVRLISLRIEEKETYYSPSEKALIKLGELHDKYSNDLKIARYELNYAKREVSEWLSKKKKR